MREVVTGRGAHRQRDAGRQGQRVVLRARDRHAQGQRGQEARVDDQRGSRAVAAAGGPQLRGNPGPQHAVEPVRFERERRRTRRCRPAHVVFAQHSRGHLDVHVVRFEQFRDVGALCIANRVLIKAHDVKQSLGFSAKKKKKKLLSSSRSRQMFIGGPHSNAVQ